MSVPILISYDLETNAQDHGGTPSPRVTFDFVAVDVFEQRSEPTRGTFTHQSPGKPEGALCYFAGDRLIAEWWWPDDSAIQDFLVDIMPVQGG